MAKLWHDPSLDDEEKKNIAKGDVKRIKYRGGHGGGQAEYDDEGRGASKEAWENFLLGFTSSGFDCEWLFQKSDVYWYRYVGNTTDRYGVADGPMVWNIDGYGDRGEGWVEKQMRNDDSRVARIVKKKCGEDVWYKAHLAIIEAYRRYKAMLVERNRASDAKWKAERSEEKKAQAAKRIVMLEEETHAIREEVDLTAGMLRSDFNEALRRKDVYGKKNGEWLDDPVAAISSGYGFGEEIQERSGIKLQVTVSLDLSNSMYHNDICEGAVNAYRNIYLALEALQQENPGDVFIHAFIFSSGEDGKWAVSLSDYYGYGARDVPEHLNLGIMEKFRKVHPGAFSGEDTRMYPLFEQIEKWENRHSDPGAVRLDIIVTDAVLEHPKDIRESSKIQERRDGALQSVFLNMLPEEQWVNSTLPVRCIQYPARKNNISGMLRNLLAEFVSVHV